MAISTPVVLTSASSQSSTSSQTTASISPPGSSLLLVWQWVGTVVDATTAPTFNSPTTTLSGVGTWTGVSASLVAARSWRGTLWYAKCGAAPGSGTITVRTTASQPRWGWIVAALTGYDDATPVRQSKTGTGTTSTLSLTLDSSPLGDSTIIGCVGSHGQDGLITPGAGYTELTEVGPIDSSGHTGQMQYDATATTTCNWSSLATTANIGVAIEVQASGEQTQPVGNALLLESGFALLMEDNSHMLLEAETAPGAQTSVRVVFIGI